MDNAVLEIVLKARDEASKTIQEMGKSVEETTKRTNLMADSFKIAGGIMTAFGVAGVAIMGDWVKKGIEAQTTIVKTNTLLADEAREMSTTSQAIYANTGSVKEQTKEIQNQIAEKQLQIQHIRLSTGSHQDEIKAIKESILALKDQKQSLKETGVEQSTVIGYTKAITVSFKDLSEAAGRAAVAYLNLGFGADSTALDFARLLGVTKDIKTANEALADAADLARFKSISLDDATTVMIRSFEGSTKALKALGIEVPKGAKGLEVLAALHSRLAGQAENYANTYQGAMDRFKVSSDYLKERLGRELLPTLDRLLDKFDQLIAWMNKLSPATVHMIAMTMAMGTAFALLVGHLGIFIGFLPMLTQGLVQAAPVMLPVALILTAIGIAAYAIYTHWQQITQAFNASRPAIDGVFQSMQKFWSQLQPQLVAFGKTLDKFINDAIKAISDFVKKNQGTITAFFEVIQGIFTFALGFLKGFWAATWQSIANVLADAWQIIKGIVEVGWGVISIFINVAMGIFTGNWKKAWEGIKLGLSYVWDGIKNVIDGGVKYMIDAIKLALDVVIGLVNGTIAGFNAVSEKASGGKIHIPSIPKFQDGGFVPATGLAVLHAGEFVLSKAMLTGQQNIPTQIMNSKTTNNTPINIYATVDSNIDMNLLGNKIAFALRNSR